MRKRIIAVFGPSHRNKTLRRKARPVRPEILAWARAVGAGVAERDHILLTGGAAPGPRSVKDIALCDVGDKRWVGVLQNGSPEPNFCAKRTNCTILPTGLGLKRNFLEALICDAAIAFAGGDGTHSAVACAFALQRPVALVNGEWKHHLDSPEGSEAATGLLKDALAFLRKEDAGADESFDSLIRECLDPARAPGLLDAARRAPEPPYRYFDLIKRDSPADVVAWATTVPQPKDMPPRDCPKLQATDLLPTAYKQWLDDIDQLVSH